MQWRQSNLGDSEYSYTRVPGKASIYDNTRAWSALANIPSAQVAIAI